MMKRTTIRNLPHLFKFRIEQTQNETNIQHSEQQKMGKTERERERDEANACKHDVM